MDNAVALRDYDEQGKTERVEMLLNKMKYNMLENCLIAQEINSEELWLFAENKNGGIGYDAPYDFVEERMGIKWRQFEKYTAIAKAFLGENKVRDELFSMSVDTLYQMTHLPQETREQIISDGSIELANGDNISLTELVALGNPKVKKEIDALKDQVKRLKKKESNLNTNIRELEKNETLYERKIEMLEHDNEHLQRLNDIPPEEQDFHRKIARVGEVRRKLIDAQSTLLTVFMYIKQIEITDDNRDIAVSGIRGLMETTIEAMNELEALFDITLARQKGAILELVDKG